MPRKSVKFYTNERLDKVDADALHALVYEHIGDVMGALLGFGAGCLSPPPISYSTAGANYYIDFGPFMYMRSVRDLASGGFGRTWRTEVVPVDTASGSQVNSLGYTSVRAVAAAAIGGGVVPPGTVGAFPFVWAKPYSNDEDTSGRRKWDTIGGSEVPFSDTTRTYRRSWLGLSDTQPGSAADPWAPIGKIVDWPNVAGADPGDPLIVPLTIWDNEEAHAVGGYPGNWHSSHYGSDATANGIDVATLAYAAREGVKVLDGVGGDIIEGFDGSKLNEKSLGLVQLLAFSRGRMQRMLTGNDTKPWWEAPDAGGDLSSIHSLAIANDARLTAIEAGDVTWFAGYVYWNGAAYVLGGGTGGGFLNITSAVKGATGNIVITPGALPAGKTVLSIQVTSGTLNIASALYIGGGSVTATIMDDTGTFVDDSFYILAKRTA